MAKNWNKTEEEVLVRMVKEKSPIEKIAKILDKSENAVYLKAYRLRIPLKEICPRPTMRRILEAKFGDVTIIQVNRSFYERTGISQKRWPKLIFGYEEPTQDEIVAVAKFFKMTYEEWARFLDVIQLNMFEV